MPSSKARPESDYRQTTKYDAYRYLFSQSNAPSHSFKPADTPWSRHLNLPAGLSQTASHALQHPLSSGNQPRAQWPSGLASSASPHPAPQLKTTPPDLIGRGIAEVMPTASIRARPALQSVSGQGTSSCAKGRPFSPPYHTPQLPNSQLTASSGGISLTAPVTGIEAPGSGGRSGDAAVSSEVLGISRSLNALLSAASTDSGAAIFTAAGGNTSNLTVSQQQQQQLLTVELKLQMEALLPFLSARCIKPEALEASMLAATLRTAVAEIAQLEQLPPKTTHDNAIHPSIAPSKSIDGPAVACGRSCSLVTGGMAACIPSSSTPSPQFSDHQQMMGSCRVIHDPMHVKMTKEVVTPLEDQAR